MCFLVNFVKERIQSELVEKLYKVSKRVISFVKQISVKGLTCLTDVRQRSGARVRAGIRGGVILYLPTLHTAADPAVRAAVKTVLSYRNNMIVAVFFTADKSKDNA